MVPRLQLILTLLAAATPAVAADALAQPSDRLGVVTTLEGAPVLSRGSAPDGRPLRFRDEIFADDTIRTPVGALVRVLMAGRAALVSVVERSEVRLAEDADVLTVRVQTGKISVVVENTDGTTPGQARIETDAVVATLRGAAVVAEVRNGATTFVVLRGEVLVAHRDGGGSSPLTLHALEAVRVVGDAVGPVEHLTPDSAAVALRDFRLLRHAPQPSQESIPDVVARQLLEAETEMQRRGMTGLTDAPTSPVGSSPPTPATGQFRTSGAAANAVVGPQAPIPPTFGTPMRGQDAVPGNAARRLQSP